MKVLLLTATLVFAWSVIAAQLNFRIADPQPDIIGLYSGSSVSGDVDGDGDNDLIVTGITPGRVTVFYLNDGFGNFTEMTDTPLRNSGGGQLLLADLDGDGDLDLYTGGQFNSSNGYALIYLNDGAGVFTNLENPELPQFPISGADLADVDGDDDLDLLIVANDEDDEFAGDIFLNDGNGVFTSSGNIAVPELEFGLVEFVDVENDGDADVLITGEGEGGASATILYLNDGTGNFAEDTDANLLQIMASDTDAADVDNDGDLDLLLSGTTDDFSVQTILYLNDGTGRFTEFTPSNLQNTFTGQNAIADMDNDGDLDIVITGTQAGGLPNIYNIVYENLGNNNFSPVDTVGGEYISAVVVGDFNGDELADIIIQGFVNRTSVYWNTSVLTSVNDFSTGPPLTLFPNPTSGQLNVTLEKEMPDLTLSIYAATGQLVYEQTQTSGSRNELQLNLRAGTYIVVMRSGNAIVNRKMLIME